MPTIPTEPTLWFDRSPRVRLEIAGPDRAKFLHNLTTNDVKRLADGAGHESFITSPQGKTLAYVTVLATPDALLLRTDSRPDSFLPHLRKYGVFDDVMIEDRSAAMFEVHVAGPEADSFAAQLAGENPVGSRPLSHGEVDLAGRPVRLIRESLLGMPGWTVVGPAELAAAVRLEVFALTGIEQGTEAVFEVRRIAAGMPASGVDVLPTNLPQEVGRDAEAINFVKGCYLGQETVARLDALGHVNRILRAGRIEGTAEVPASGTSLVDSDGKPAGSITSAAGAPGGGAVFLAYVRVAHAEAGTRLAIPTLADAAGGPAVAIIAGPDPQA